MAEPDASYLCAYVDQSPRLRLEPGRTGVARLRLRNIGTAVWRRGGPNPVLLATDRPLDRPSAFQGPTWPTANRLARLREPAVPPGATGSFEIVLRAPAAPGRYVEALRPVAEGLIWFNDLELSLRIDVVVPVAGAEPDLAAELVEPVPPLLMRPGEQRTVAVRLRNAGRVRWTDRAIPEYGPLVQLATVEPNDHDGLFHSPEGWISPRRPARMPGFVLPGETVELRFPVAAPPSPGVYQECYGLVAEQLAWFPGPAVPVRIMVV